MFGKLMGKLKGGVDRFSGKTDFLEAVCAAQALAAAADGHIDDKEIEMASKTAKSNPLLVSFGERKIGKVMDDMLARAGSGRSGRHGLYKEIADVADNTDMAEAVYLCAADVADSDGCGKEELAVLTKIATTLNVDQAKLDV